MIRDTFNPPPTKDELRLERRWTMTTSKASPRPWRAQVKNHAGEPMEPIVSAKDYGGYNGWYFTVNHPSMSAKEAVANAHLIVLAVNHFEEMRAIIQRCSEWLDSEGFYDTEVDKLLAKLTEVDDD